MSAKSKKSFTFVTLYSTTQMYGGPEEGGWWYYWNDKILTRRVKKNRVEQTVSQLKKLGRNEGYRFSEDKKYYRGNKAEIIVEDFPGEYQTKRRPYYE